MGFSSTYRTLFVIGSGTLALGIGLGVYQSWVTDRRLPPVSLSDMSEIGQLLDDGDYSEAISRLEVALPLMPESRHKIHEMIGNAYNAMGDYDRAIEHFLRATEIAPAYSPAQNNLGVAYVGKGEAGLAVARFDLALRADPSFAAARQNLGRAVKDYEGLVGPEPADAAARRILDSAREALATTGPSPAAAAGEAESLAGARRLVEAFHRQEFDWLHASFTDEFAGRMSLDQLTRFQGQLAAEVGVETELIGDRIAADGTDRVYSRWARFDKFPGVVELTLVVRDDGTVDDLRVRLGEGPPN